MYDIGDVICINQLSSDPLEAKAIDYTATQNTIAETSGTVDVAAMETAVIAEHSQKAHDITGAVFDSQGNPAKAATIILREHGGNATTDPNYVSPPVTTDESGNFHISTGPVDEDFYALTLFAQSSDGTEQAIGSLRDITGNRWGRLRDCVAKPIELRLTKPRDILVTVQNKDDKLAQNATIQVVLGNRLPGYIAGETDANGRFVLKLPEGITAIGVVAFKSGEGIDYIMTGDRFDTNVVSVPEHVELKLTGVLPRKVQFVDEHNNALVGLPIAFEGLALPGKSGQISVIRPVVTDSQGIAPFDFLPPEIIPDYAPNSLTLIPRAFSYPIGYSLTLPTNPAEAARVTKITLCRCATITGRVLKADGTPVPDLQVKASSSGNFWNSSFTDAEGRYSLRKMPTVFAADIPRDYVHTSRKVNGIVVPRGPLTIEPWSGFDVKPGEQIEHDLLATEGTLVRAKLIINDGTMSFAEYKELLKDNPSKNFRYSLDYQYAGEKNASPVQGDRTIQRRECIYGMSENMNDDGEAVFRLPPGIFEIQPSVTGAIVETIDGEKVKSVDYPVHEFVIEPPKTPGEERIIECRVRISSQITYTLRAVRGDNPSEVLSGVKISVYPDDKTQYSQRQLTTDENGEAAITRTNKPLTYLALDTERQLGASNEWFEIPEGQTVIDIPMFPLCKATGTLVQQNRQPFANKEFQCRMNRTIPQFDGAGQLTSRLMIMDGEPIPAKTDENGYFEIGKRSRSLIPEG